MKNPTSPPPADILIVDDDAWSAILMKRLLERYGFSAATAASGEEALSRCEHSHVKAVVADVNMPPGIDGIEMCRRMRTLLASPVPVVLLSASCNDDLRRRAESVGATAVLEKPINPTEFPSTIRELLG